MKNIFKPLADLEFANLLAEAYADTHTGASLINRYRQFLLTNPATCNVVNSFVNEAKNCMYDMGIVKLVEEITGTIEENKVSWKLATACENINASRSSYNYLNRNAASVVEKLLEQNENEVVKYIKAGALKNVMFCEAFRNIVGEVFTDKQQIITEEYTAFHPVSYVEIQEGRHLFEVLGKIYAVEGNKIEEAKATDVSGEFLAISRLLESNNASFDANTEVLTVNTPMAVYTIFENDGKPCCKRKSKSKECEGKECKEDESVAEELTFNDECQLREHNRLVVGATSYKIRNHVAELLESIAKTFEHFNQIMLLDNCQIISSKNDKFVVIENADNAYAYLVASNHNNGWKINTTIVEALEFIKKNTNLNINKDYKENINKQIEVTEAAKKEQIKESIKEGELNARKQRIEALTEKYKNDPAALAVLASVAEELNSIEE